MTSHRASRSPRDSLVAACNRFGFRLFSRLVSESEGTNVFFSPAGVALALALPFNGAAGETRRAMADTLELGAIEPAELNDAWRSLLTDLLAPDPQIDLLLATTMLARPDLTLEPTFLHTARASYDALVETVDFGDPDALRRVNVWVEEKTRGAVTDLLEPGALDPATALVIVNALHYKGRWAQPFDPEATAEGTFFLPDGREKQLPLMSRAGPYRYHEDADLQVAELPYGDGRFNLYLLVPSDPPALRARLELTAEGWDALRSKLATARGRVTLPRFRFDFGAELSAALSALGMGVAFDSSADFRGLTPEPLAISEVMHKAVLDVEEEGTEAAAASAVVMGRSVDLEAFTLTADRPFLTLIQDTLTGLVLFLGVVMEPG